MQVLTWYNCPHYFYCTWHIVVFYTTNVLLFQVLIGGTAQIIQSNVTAENGFVHVIDKVRHK